MPCVCLRARMRQIHKYTHVRAARRESPFTAYRVLKPRGIYARFRVVVHVDPSLLQRMRVALNLVNPVSLYEVSKNRQWI